MRRISCIHGLSLSVLLLLLVLAGQTVEQASAFVFAFQSALPTATSSKITTRSSCPVLAQSSSNKEEAPAASAVITVERVLQDNYPAFYSVLKKNDNIFTTLEQDFSDTGYTIFAPNAAALEEVGSKRLAQLNDPRNLETAQKMGLYHVVTEALSLTQLNREDWTVPKTGEGLPALKYSALVTMGGEVPIGRYKKKTNGGFFRSLVGKPQKTIKDKDGNTVTEIVVGPSGTILRSVKVGNAIIHEVDGLVSPEILWRYCDQLRIPGF